MQEVKLQPRPQPLESIRTSSAVTARSLVVTTEKISKSNVPWGTQWPLLGSHSVEDLEETRNKSHRRVGEEPSGRRNSTCKGPAAGGQRGLREQGGDAWKMPGRDARRTSGKSLDSFKDFARVEKHSVIHTKCSTSAPD